MKRLLTLLLGVLTATQVFAATGKVALVYNGTTEVTRETYKFLRTRLGYDLVAVSAGSTINAADYKGVIVLNVNVASGVDTTLQKWIQSFTPKSKVIVVSLYTNTTSTTVTVTTAAQSSLGVDAVTAASLWSERRGGSSTILAMHEAWVERVAELLAAK